MKTLSGIKALRELKEKANQSYEKADWFSLKDGNTVIKFLQELDEDSPSYRADRGVAITVLEHMPPGDRGYLARAMCTLEDEGRCWACEQNQKGDQQGKWYPKRNFYCNVLDGNDGKVKVFSRKFNSAVVDQIIDIYDEKESITSDQFKISKGSERNSPWTLMHTTKTVLDDSDVSELWDLQKVALREIPYDKQAAYYTPYIGDVEESKPAAKQKDVSDNLDW